MPRASLDSGLSAAIAVLLSVIIWLAASEGQRPIENATVPANGGIPVAFHGVPPGYDAYAVGDPRVEVDVRGIVDRAQGLESLADDVEVWADVEGIEPDAATHERPLRWSCRACARQGVRVLGTRPSAVDVRFDPLVTETRTVSIQVAQAAAESLVVERSAAVPDAVRVSGPQRFVARVRAVVARIAPSAVEDDAVELPVVLAAEDRQGTPVPGVTVEPPAAVVALDFSRRGYRLPIAPEFVGDVPAGYFWWGHDYEPVDVTVAGEADAMTALIEAGRVATEPIDLAGVTSDRTLTTTLRLPPGAEALDLPSGAVTVTIQVRRQPGSRAVDVPVVAAGLGPALAFTPSPGTVRVLVTGPQPVVEAIRPTDISATVDVRGLEPGRHRIEVRVAPPRELEALTVTPDTIEVVLEPIGGPALPTRTRAAP